MNRQRRKQIRLVLSDLSNIWRQMDQIICDERKYWESIPINLLEADNSKKSQSATDDLERVAEALDISFGDLENAIK